MASLENQHCANCIGTLSFACRPKIQLTRSQSSVRFSCAGVGFIWRKSVCSRLNFGTKAASNRCLSTEQLLN